MKLAENVKSWAVISERKKNLRSPPQTNQLSKDKKAIWKRKLICQAAGIMLVQPADHALLV